jgi:phosphate-selective porin OprO and OprP
MVRAPRWNRVAITFVALCAGVAHAQEAVPPPAPTSPPPTDVEALARAYQQLLADHQRLVARVAEQERRESIRARDVLETLPGPSRPALVGFGPNGFFLRTPDDTFLMRVRSVLQADGRAYFGEPLQQQDTFLIRRARLYIEGTVGDFLDYRLMPDFAGSQVTLFDAWINLRPWTWLQLRGGKMKTPFGLERLQAEQNLVFVERGLTSDLVPDRDIGVSLHGELLHETFLWEAGVFNGVPDGGSADQDNNFGKDFVFRVFAHPFRPLHRSWLDDFGFGFAATYGKQHGTVGNTGLSSFKSEGQIVFFTWLADPKTNTLAIAEGGRWRIDPQLYYYAGPVGLQAEYVYTSTDVSTGINRATIGNQAWQVEVEFVLTLEHPTYGALRPRRPFSMKLRGVGAFSLAARVDQLFVNDAAFPDFADPTKSARRATGWALQLNWYLTANVRFELMFERTIYEGGDGLGDRAPENGLLGQLQVAF